MAVPAAHPRPPPVGGSARAATATKPDQSAALADGRAIGIGDILNNSYEVTRFIARGGMGEVFEGVSLIGDERVAIKVMLPALAADPNVIELFKKEARTLTRFSHDALVKYRQISQSRELGILYMVTEFVDGINLADVLKTIEPTIDQLTDLLRRLASGMAVAHDCGAVHRDLSPDNILLESGSISRPKVIDFGIAKDLDPGSETVVGQGFAGKLGYVAPEQLGAYERKVGAWTDIYSLGLVILAVTKRGTSGMGGSLVDAIDKRKIVPDLSSAPEPLRPVLEKMLQPEPSQRFQSMHDVVAALAGESERPRIVTAERRAPSRPMLLGAGIGVVAAIGLAVAVLSGGEAGPSDAASGVDLAQRARTAIGGALPDVECSWLDIAALAGKDQIAVRMTGVAGFPTEARNRIEQALTSAEVPNPSVNFDDVAFIQSDGCAALSTLGQIRTLGGGAMSVPAREFEKRRNLPGSDHDVASRAAVTLNLRQNQDFTLLGIEPVGLVEPIIPSRESIPILEGSGLIKQVAPGRYEFRLDMTHTGWSGLIFISGDGPFDQRLLTAKPVERTPEWRSRFLALASERGWKSEMIWFRSVDKDPSN